jgi:ABC-type Zn uptake system ZnuABC Zn-binding protein ZnuA
MHRTFLVVVLTAVAVVPSASADQVRVVTSIPDLAAIAAAIGGEHVSATSIVKGNRDVHAVELLPSLMLKVRRADVYIKVGLDLDLWSRDLIDGSRNRRLVVVDASQHVEVLEVPTFKVDASYGDLHRFGNPHYWLDPATARPIGEAILAGLTRAAPEHASQFRANLEAYAGRMDEALAGWQRRLEPYRGTEVVSFHNSWPYFAHRFGLEVVEYLEPNPGIPPTPSHIAALLQLLEGGRVRVILMESYFDDRVPEMLSRSTGVPVVKVPVLVGAAPDVDDQFSLFDTIVQGLEGALEGG